VATKLDILVWDDSFKRVRALGKRCPYTTIRKAINIDDFVEGLSHKPTLVILGEQTEITAEQLKQIFEDELTEATSVLIWLVAPDSREILAEIKKVDLISTSGFSFTNKYLWISTYNILNG